MVNKKIIVILVFILVVIFTLLFVPKSWQESLKDIDHIYLDIIARENPVKYSFEESKEIIEILQEKTSEIEYSHRFFPMYILSYSSFKLEIKLEDDYTIIKINEKYFHVGSNLYFKIKDLLNDNYDNIEFYNRIQYYKDSSTKEESAKELLSSIYNSDIIISSISTYPYISELLGGIYYKIDNIKYFAVVIIDNNRLYFIADKEDGVGEIVNEEFAKLIYNNSVLGSHDH